MRNGKLSRRSVLKGSTVFAAPSLFPKLLKAAAPDPTAVSPALIEAAMKEDTVAFYTAMEIPVAAALGKAFEAKYPGIVVQVKRSGAERVFQRIGKEEAIRLHEVDVVLQLRRLAFYLLETRRLARPLCAGGRGQALPI